VFFAQTEGKGLRRLNVAITYYGLRIASPLASLEVRNDGMGYSLRIAELLRSLTNLLNDMRCPISDILLLGKCQQKNSDAASD